MKQKTNNSLNDTNDSDKEYSKLFKRAISEYLFKEKAKRLITLKYFNKRRIQMIKIATLALIENPAIVALAFSIVSGVLFALWNVSINIALLLIKDNEDIRIFINNMNDSTSWVALFFCVALLIICSFLRSWSYDKFKYRKKHYLDKYDHQRSIQFGLANINTHKNSGKIISTIWLIINCMMFEVNVASLEILIHLEVGQFDKLIWTIMISMSAVINAFHIWCLTPLTIQHEETHCNNNIIILALSIWFSIIFCALFFLNIVQSALFSTGSISNKYTYSILVIFLFVFVFNALWMAVTGTSCLNGVAIQKSTRPNNERKSISSWIMRELHYLSIILIIEILLILIIFIAWIVGASSLIIWITPVFSQLFAI